MTILAAYVKYAESIMQALWFGPIEKHGRPALSKAQIQSQIKFAVETRQAEDGDPTTWVDCDHCEGSGLFLDAVRLEPIGMCYQCYGKGQQSIADRRRNWGYKRQRVSKYGDYA